MNFIIFIFYLLLTNIYNDKNEIKIVINKTINSEIINQYYKAYISEVIINEYSSNIYDYKNFLNKEINNITIKFNKKLDTCEEIFIDLKNILYIDTSNFFSKNMKSMWKMFQNCESLTSLDLKLDTSSVTDMYSMFRNCTSLISLDLSDLNTSSVKNMGFMFDNCYSLKILDISKLDTSSVTRMYWMFSNCSSLNSLDLSNFNTSSVISMDGMFSDCSSLKTLDLSNFNTSSVNEICFMFSDCRALMSLNIDNIDVSQVNDVRYMFYHCDSLVSLNLTNFNINTDNYYGMFLYCNKDLLYCIDDKKTYNFLHLLSNYENNCADICVKWKSKKYIIEENLCIDDCEDCSSEQSECEYECENETENEYNKISDNNEDSFALLRSDKKISVIIILIIVFIVILILAGIIIIIIIYKKKSNEIKISFLEDNNVKTIINISKEQKISDLINLYYKKRKIKNYNQKKFFYDELNITSEEYKNKKIKNVFVINLEKQFNDFSSSEVSFNIHSKIENGIDNNQSFKISPFEIIVIEEGNIKIIFNDISHKKTEIYMTNEKTVNDLIIFYYKKKGIKNDNQNIFLLKKENIALDEYKNQKIKNFAKKCILKISVFEKGNIKINFYEESEFLFESYISQEKPVNDLISLFYEKKGIKYDNCKIFFCNKENIALEGNKNKKIKEFVTPEFKYSLKISIFEKGIIKVDYYEKSRLLFEVFISSKKKVSDLYDIYYEKRGIINQNTKYFLCNSEAIFFEENKNTIIGDYIQKSLDKYSLMLHLN